MAKINDGLLVARVRSTRKGKKVALPNGVEIGGNGKGGRSFYEVHKLGVGLWTCSCPAYRFARGKVGTKKPCKHMLKLWHEWKSGIIDGVDVVVYNPEAL